MRGRKETEGIEWTRPASGLVTALDPVMRASGGTWIAHGSGSADRETADARGRLRVPPDRPSYTLRRVWLTPEEEQGYYYGCANNALVAALSHRLRAPAVRRYGLASVREGESPLRRCGDRRGRRRPRRGVRAGLSLRAAAAIRQGSAPRRDGVPVLAHSVAEPRSVPRLPVEGRHPARPARQRPARLPRAVSLQQLPRHGGSRARVARRLRALCRLARRPPDLRAAVSDQHRSVVVEGARPGPPTRPRSRARCARRSG